MNMLHDQKPWVLAVLSGLLMALSFPEIGDLNLIMGVAWVPLLLMESRLHHAKRAGAKIFGLSYLTFLIYNALTSYWIYFSDPTASIMAFLANSLLMSIAFWLFYFTKKHVGAKQGYIGFVFFWLAFEYQHYNWELSHPWLTLGNVFANAPILVQWYEWTGALGGSMWLLVINLLVFGLIQLKTSGAAVNLRQVRTFWIVLGVWLIVPMSYSFIRYFTFSEKIDPIEVVLAQPNLDPYTEKFGPDMLGPMQQLDSVFIPVKALITEKTQIVLAPETAIPFEFNEASFASGQRDYDYIMQNMSTWNHPDLLIGASTFKYYTTKRSVASRASSDGQFYESCNTSVLISQQKSPEFVHKSKLVLGVERIPFLKQLPILETFSMEMGGAYGTLGVEDKAVVLE